MKKAIGLLALVTVFLGTAWLSSSWAQAAAAPAAAPAPAAAAPAAAAPAAAAEQPEGHSENMSFATIVFRSGWFGVLIWVLLFGCSIISVALTVDSFITIREAKIAPPALVEAVRKAMEEGDVVKAIHHCEQSNAPLAAILQAGFANVAEGFEVVQDSVTIAADMESEKLMARVTYLSVISNTTPMLGLIGTVQGMIFAFFNLGTKAAGAAQQAMLALNISHGLWATAVGLTVAVQATIFFYFFKNRAMRSILGMEKLTLDVIKSLRNVEVVAEE